MLEIIAIHDTSPYNWAPFLESDLSLNSDIYFYFFKKNGTHQGRLSFPLNNCMFDADYNSDGAIDSDDLKLAEQKFNFIIK
jgi:hypothetical protein